MINGVDKEILLLALGILYDKYDDIITSNKIYDDFIKMGLDTPFFEFGI
jgi:hypothetical protein